MEGKERGKCLAELAGMVVWEGGGGRVVADSDTQASCASCRYMSCIWSSVVIMGQGQAARRRGLVVRSLSAKPNIIACLHPAGLRHVGAQTSAMMLQLRLQEAVLQKISG